MKNIIFVTLLAVFTVFSCNEKTKTKEDVTTYYLIRHAEKDRTNKTNRNPNLKKEGLQRAKRWAKHFKNIRFNMVYSTDYNRTKQTAMPTAKANNLELQIYDPSNYNIEAFMAKTKGKTVLIVGHSNTTPIFANTLLGEQKYKMMADNDNASLYIVTIANGFKTSEIKTVN
ncbi:MAG: SixA phosphatase family protein [Winogradskyella sp.]